MERVFVDSSGFIAATSLADKDHATASTVYSRLAARRIPLVTTNHVVDEVCTWLLRYGQREHASAVEFGRFVRVGSTPVLAGQMPSMTASGNLMLLVYSTPELESRAWAIFEKYDTSGFSFTDCVSFAVMEALSIKQAFTFDEHYDVMGFERLPG